MTTPYDTARRLQERQLDQLRREIALAAARASELETQLSAIGAQTREELALAAIEPTLSSSAFLQTQIARRERALTAKAQLARDIEAFQERAREALGLKAALDELARLAREERLRAETNAEQQYLDDQSERRRRA